MWNAIAEQISQATGQTFTLEKRQSVGGGCINQSYQLQGAGQTYFVKLNQASQVAMFSAEALGLKQMAQTRTIRVPEPLCYGVSGDSGYLVLTWCEFGRGTQTTWEQMGRNLAALHLQPQGDRFGWQQENTIGSTPQPNPWTSTWADFFAEHRIGYQLQLAQRRGGHFPQAERFIESLRQFLRDRQPQPALVHGDLWSGNASFLSNGEPVIFDPACYYGDPEVDIAMTELFGGFPPAFYQGYQAINPLDAGYQQRKNLYNLYHILNHFNLFGGGYLAQAQRIIQNFLR
jgi:fructosamine-3-kinase